MDRQYPPPQHNPYDYPGSGAQRPPPNAAPTGAMSGYGPPPPPPPTAQAPVHVPYADPFHTRDPFLPNTHHRRAESYGSNITPERAWSTQQAPQHANMTASRYSQAPYMSHDQSRGPAPPSGHAPGNFEHARRRSLGGLVSPSHGRVPFEPPPPPPFASRNMPPPSPSATGAPPFSNNGYRAPPSAHFGGPHEHRPTGGMSINALIGSDRPPRAETSPKAMTTHNSPTMRAAHPLSPKRARSTSIRSEYGRPPRQPSPRSQYSASHDPRYERERYFAARPDYGPVATPASAPNFRQYQSSPTSDHLPPGPERPISQPVTSAYHNRPDAWSEAQHGQPPPATFREYSGHVTETQARRNGDDHYDPPQYERPRYADMGPAPPPSHFAPPVRYPDREWHGDQRYHQPDRREYPPENGRPENLHIVARRPSPPSVERAGAEARFRHYGGSNVEHEGRQTPLHVRKEDDGISVARSRLTVSPEMNRKGGRSSPLPQAVHGAQPQLVGPGRDPSIKIEFGRMFSGLGSGVGGGGTPGPYSAAGNLTPSRLSPPRFADRDMNMAGETEIIVNGQSVLRPQSQHEIASAHATRHADGRDTPTNGKRLKTTHPSHHHHHHGHAHGHGHGHSHHHHHHHHTPADDGTPTRTGFSTMHCPPSANGSQEPPAKAVHHHHHYHTANVPHAGHHHHHAQPGTASGLLPHLLRSPAPVEVLIRKSDVQLESSTRPTHHLGSALYATALSLPANKSRNLVDTKALFASAPRPLPKFDRKENCTFTVRVPREYLCRSGSPRDMLAGGLEEICRRRALWGTEVYSDDSDVVAAAVHSGWIRGSFGIENDQDLLALFPEEAQSSEVPVGDKLDAQPKGPITIPSDRDMHVTIRLLPPLQKYVSSTRHHLRSRGWASDHDGMSFQIHAIEFVDEPHWSRFSERGPKARKDRLKGELRRRRDVANGLSSWTNGVSVGA